MQVTRTMSTSTQSPSRQSTLAPEEQLGEHDHDACVSRVLAEIQALDKDLRAKFTPTRLRVLEILLESHTALGAYEVLRRMGEPAPKPPIIYRALDFLIKKGFAHRIERLNAYVACADPNCSRDNPRHPAFLICRVCNIVAEAHVDCGSSLIEQAAGAAGFQVEQTVVEVIGLCPSCANGEHA